MEPITNPYASPLSDDPPPPPRPAEANWLPLARVASGLQLIWLGIGCCMTPPVLAVLMPLIGPAFPFPFETMVGLGCLLLLLAGALLNFTGSVACTAMPVETGGRGLMIASLVTMVATVALPLFVVAQYFHTMGEGMAIAWFSTWLMLQSASSVCFLLSLRRLNRHLGRIDLVRWTGRILAVLVGATIVFGALMACTDSTGGNRLIPADVYVGLMWLDGFVGWMGFLAEVMLIRATRRAILSRQPARFGHQL